MRIAIPEQEKFFTDRALASLMIPLVIEQFLALLIGIVNTLMVSGVSEAAVSALSLVESVNTLLIQLFSAMGTGGAVVAAQYLGRHEPLNACRAAKQLLYASLLLSLIIMSGSLLFCRGILLLFFGNLEPATMGYAETYFSLSALSYPALALYNGSAALMRAMGNSKAAMFIALVMNILNAGSNAALMYGMRLEVAGAGIATLISRMVGAVLITRLLLNPGGRIHMIRPFHFQADRGMIRRIFRIGVPNGLENSMFQIGKLMVSGIVATYSVSMIAAYAVASNIANLFNLPGVAIGLGMVTVIGQCAGAGDTRQIRYYAARLLRLVYGTMAAGYLLLFVAARPLARAFHLSPEAVEAAVEMLRYYAVLAAVFWPASFALPNALRAVGDARFTMGTAVFSMWVFRVGLSYLLAFSAGMGLLGIWFAMFADWIARSACFAWRYRGERWLRKSVV